MGKIKDKVIALLEGALSIIPGVKSLIITDDYQLLIKPGTVVTFDETFAIVTYDDGALCRIEAIEGEAFLLETNFGEALTSWIEIHTEDLLIQNTWNADMFYWGKVQPLPANLRATRRMPMEPGPHVPPGAHADF